MSKRTMANFDAAQKTRVENERLQRQINWLLGEIMYAADAQRKEWAMCGFCPSDSGDYCELVFDNGSRERPDCRRCWRERALRGAG